MAMVAPPSLAEGSQNAFAYPSQPQAVPSKRRPSSRHREAAAATMTPDNPPWMDENEIEASNNVMYDRRVVRGNTYAAQVVTQSAQRESMRLRQEHARRLRLEALRRRQAAELSRIPRTPSPVEGRAHMDAQTEELLEVLTDKPAVASTETQTEAFIDRPSSPLFVPAKSGADVVTQVVVGDLFDFDLEVEPILEVLVGKTLELSVLEIMEEEELTAIKRREAIFIRQRDAEMAEVQRMEAEAKRKSSEKMRRMKQHKEFMEARKALLEKVAARSFAKNYLYSLRIDVFDALEEDGYFYDPLVKEVRDSFLPWLLDGVVERVDRAVNSISIVDGFLLESVAQASRIHKEAVKAKALERARILAEAKAAAAAEEARKKAEEEARKKAEEEEARAKAEEDAQDGNALDEDREESDVGE
ncbi:unnamed protein product [Ascophyllum nodosum]